MNCPHCGTKLKIIDSRPYGKNKRIRKYRCAECGYEDTTIEEMEEQQKE